MRQDDFVNFMRATICKFEQSNSYGTAHIYKNSLSNLIAFYRTDRIPFKKITPELLKGFEFYLRQKQLSWNTVSTYLRTIRATYNRAVDRHLAPYIPRLFKQVYTGTRADRKKALNAKEMAQIFQSWKNRDISETHSRTHGLFILMFLLRGLPFADLVNLHKKDLNGNTISYRRRKTGRQLTIDISREAWAILNEYMDTDPHSPYLFPFLTGKEGSIESYREYQWALRTFNQQLNQLKGILHLKTHLSSYTARHTWATLAYYNEIHPGIISEAMGHSSITVTETYLKPFNATKIDDANRKVISSIAQHRLVN